MKFSNRIRFVLPLLIASTVSAQTAPKHAVTTQDTTPVAGVWRAECDGMPCMSLTVSDEIGGLSGAILFYFHMRKTANDPYTSTPGIPEPIFNPTFDGQTLTFQVSHRRAHPPRTLSDPPVSFRLVLKGPNRAELINANEKGPTVIMTRSDY